ncbi:MAG: phage major capsid protein [Veillonellaceae bacterium]|nr:phage major capsid protein [Veillonellaceae bacterium]
MGADTDVKTDERATVDDLKTAVAEGVKEGVAEALKAVKSADAEKPAETVQGATPEDVAKAIDEAVTKANADWQVKLDRAIAENRAVIVRDRGADEVKEAEFYEPSDKGLRLTGAAAKASDYLYIDMVVKGIDNPKKSRIHSNAAMMKALDTATDGSGADYVPEGFSGEFVRDVQSALKMAGAFRRVPMSTKTLKLPVEGNYPTAYYFPENVTRATEITESSPTTGDVTLTAKKLAIRTIESFEYEDDAYPLALQIIRNKLITGVARGIEDAIVNGDTAGSHMDADVTASTDRRKAFLGLRAKAIDNAGANEDISSLTGEALCAIAAGMGEYGIDNANLAWVVGTSGYNSLLNLRDAKDNALVTTVDKYGPGATILSGEIAKLYGKPVLYTPFMRETLNASGVYDGTTVTKTGIMLVWLPAWLLGDRMNVTLEVQRFAASQNSDLVCVWRGDFVHALGSALTTAMGVNLGTL